MPRPLGRYKWALQKIETYTALGFSQLMLDVNGQSVIKEREQKTSISSNCRVTYTSQGYETEQDESMVTSDVKSGQKKKNEDLAHISQYVCECI